MTKTSSINHKSMSEFNTSRVLRTLCMHAPISRIDIAKKTGLSSMTVSNIVAEFLEQGLITEVTTYKNSVNTSLGRKPILLDIASTSPCIIGIHISRDYSTVALGDYKGNIITEENFSMELYTTNDLLLNHLVSLCKKLITNTNRIIKAIGVTSIGPINIHTGMILSPPNFGTLKNIPIVSTLKSATSLPVFLINDANAAALAEKMYGAGQTVENFIYLRIGNGIGSGIIQNGTLYNGLLGMSGEIGHMCMNIDGPLCKCGNRGCLENYVSIKNIVNQVNAIHHFNPPLLWEDIIDLFNTKQKLFQDIFDSFCKYLSYALVNIINLLDIHTVIVEYEHKNSGDAIEKLLEISINQLILSKENRHITVLPSKLNHHAALKGAIGLICSKLFNAEI